MWAVGTIFAEVLNNLPLFAGEGDIRQIYKVVQVLGKPPSKDWYGAGELPDLNKISFFQLVNLYPFLLFDSDFAIHLRALILLFFNLYNNLRFQTRSSVLVRASH